jgi:hypothetical protein
MIKQKRLECFGTANSSDACLQCPDNSECAEITCASPKDDEVKEGKTMRKIPRALKVLLFPLQPVLTVLWIVGWTCKVIGERKERR